MAQTLAVLWCEPFTPILECVRESVLPHMFSNINHQFHFTLLVLTFADKSVKLIMECIGSYCTHINIVKPIPKDEGWDLSAFLFALKYLIRITML